MPVPGVRFQVSGKECRQLKIRPRAETGSVGSTTNGMKLTRLGFKKGV
jgi:hypothetical protein